MESDDDFYRLILAAPLEDMPRLAYADFLDENAGTIQCKTCNGGGRLLGISERHPIPNKQIQIECKVCKGAGTVGDGKAERAAFIRVQCELARLPDTEHERRAELKEIERVMIIQNGLTWANNAIEFVGRWYHTSKGIEDGRGRRVTFRRGFPGGLRIGKAELIERAESLFSLLPIEDVTVMDRMTEMEYYRHFWTDEPRKIVAPKWPHIKWVFENAETARALAHLAPRYGLIPPERFDRAVRELAANAGRLT